VNLSLGSGAFTEPCDDFAASTKAAIDNLRSVGIATVIASGNNACTDAGGDPQGCRDALSTPACISSAVSVSAVKDNGGVANFANRAPFLSLYAPGVGIRAPEYFTVSSTRVASGTSTAAPHVAGAWALVRQAVPGASVSEVLAAFQDSGEPLPDAPVLRARDALGLLGYPACDDGLDDDGDGLVDLDDPGCADATDRSEQAAELVCDNGLDDDGDGAIDAADPGCREPRWSIEDPACDDGLDNDGDGGTDFAGEPSDPQCQASWWGSESPSSCGLGPSLAVWLPLWGALRRRRVRRCRG
jgi:subtilisin family serine protease